MIPTIVILNTRVLNKTETNLDKEIVWILIDHYEIPGGAGLGGGALE